MVSAKQDRIDCLGGGGEAGKGSVAAPGETAHRLLKAGVSPQLQE